MTDVRLAVYDLTGREITNLFEGKKEAGSYEAVFDASNRKGSVYICKLRMNDKVIIKKMVVTK